MKLREPTLRRLGVQGRPARKETKSREGFYGHSEDACFRLSEGSQEKKAMRSFTEEDTSRLAREDEPPVSFVFGWMVLVVGADFL